MTVARIQDRVKVVLHIQNGLKTLEQNWEEKHYKMCVQESVCVRVCAVLTDASAFPKASPV